MHGTLTKCHILLAAALAVLTLASCRKAPEGPSLSQYSERSEATQNANFENYVIELRALPLEEALARQEAVMQEAEADTAAWQRITRLQEHFLLDPNSPYRSEELYIPVVNHLLSSDKASGQQRLRAEWIAPRIVLNRIGTPAADFHFQLRNGRPATLYGTIDAASPDLTLLFFSNPGCPNCKEITDALSKDLKVQMLISEGKLLVVNIYPDEDIQAWLDYLPEYPSEWVCGRDPDGVLNSSTLYWLRAIPSLYLLDREKRVILKDATLEDVLLNCKQR